MRYGFVIDQDRCIGCHACTVACKTEHNVPLGVNRTWVKYVEKGAWPDTRRHFTVLRCNHCSNPPCVTICPTRALFRRADGIVDFDTARCIGCKSCMQACPYNALYIDPDEHTAQKCNYCAHRVEAGIEPACVVVCPEQAIIAGDLENPTTAIARLVATAETTVRAPEQGTGPAVFYKGADQSGLEPLTAVQRAGSLIWRDDPEPAPPWLAVDMAGGPAPPGDPSGGPPRVVYTADQPMPWGWKVSSYFLTKGISAGLSIVVALALLLGAEVEGVAITWLIPLLAGVLLAATGVLLVADLKRPDRFLYLLTKGNPTSWLVRGAWILSLYAGLLAVWFLVGIAGSVAATRGVAVAAAVVGLGVAGYTSFLFGQAEGRDLWQSSVLLWHMLAGALACGGGGVLVVAAVVPVADVLAETGRWSLAGGALALGLIGLAEGVARHPTRNVAVAMHHLTRGAHRREWWSGILLAAPVAGALAVMAGTLGPWGGVAGGVAAWVGIWQMDNAFVKAGQSVPLS